MSICSFIKRTAPKIRMLCFVLINSVLSNLSCVGNLVFPPDRCCPVGGPCRVAEGTGRNRWERHRELPGHADGTEGRVPATGVQLGYVNKWT